MMHDFQHNFLVHIKILEREHWLRTSYCYFLDRPAIKVRISLRNDILMHIPSISFYTYFIDFLFAGEGCYSICYFKILVFLYEFMKFLQGGNGQIC